MVPTAVRLSAQPAIIKIRRVVDALIILILAARDVCAFTTTTITTTTATHLYGFTALLLLLVEHPDKYTATIAPSSP